MREHLGDGPVEPRFRQMMNALASTIDEAFNGKAQGKDRKNGFVLILFPFEEPDKARSGEQARCNYISNANRQDVVVMLKEQIKRFEGQPEVTGTA